MDKDFVITVRLRAEQVNLILAKLGQCPFNEVVEVIGTLKSQGDAALEAARYTAHDPTEAPSNGLDQVRKLID